MTSSSSNLPHRKRCHYSAYLLSSHSDQIKNINEKTKTRVRKEDRSHIWSSREQSHQDTLFSILSDCAPSAIKSAKFFTARWIKSKNCSLWNEVGLVRTLGIQRWYSKDFQVSNIPEKPSIVISLKREDTLSVPEPLYSSGCIPPQSYFRMTSRSQCWPRSPSSMMCERWNAANPSDRRLPDQTKVNLRFRWGGKHSHPIKLWVSKH